MMSSMFIPSSTAATQISRRASCTDMSVCCWISIAWVDRSRGQKGGVLALRCSWWPCQFFLWVFYICYTDWCWGVWLCLAFRRVYTSAAMVARTYLTRRIDPV